MKLVKLVIKNLTRNVVRTTLTSLGTMVLVFVVTLVWSILYLLDTATAEKSHNLKAIITERWTIPSQMPFAYAASLSDAAARKPDDVHPDDSMTWQFYGGTLDPASRTRENFFIAFAMDPAKLTTMMDDLDNLEGANKQLLDDGIAKMQSMRNGALIGREKLRTMNKRVGERFKVFGFLYKNLDLEFEIVGTFPEGRYDQTAVIHRDYLNEAIDRWPLTHAGKKHPIADRSLNLVWLKLSDRDEMDRATQQIMSSPYYTTPAVKCETASSGIAAFLDAYRDLIWGMRWLLSPAILITLALVISNAISISVRERRMEMAVLKVLGFRPGQLLLMVLAEAVLIGALSGLASAGTSYLVVNKLLGGVKFPIAFFPAFFIPGEAIVWGLAIGTITALAGSVMPAWNARSVKVSDVFSKVA